MEHVIRWILAVVFVLSAFEKSGRLRDHTEPLHPIILQRNLLRKHAKAVIAGSLSADLVITGALLLADSALPLLMAAAMIVVYTVAAIMVPAQALGGGCSCTNIAILESRSRSALLLRNGSLLALAGVGLIEYTAIITPFATSLGFTIVLVVVLVVLPRGMDTIIERRSSGHPV